MNVVTHVDSKHQSFIDKYWIVIIVLTIIGFLLMLLFGRYVAFTAPYLLKGNDVVSVTHSDNGIISRTYYLSKLRNQVFTEQSCSSWDAGSILFGDPEEAVIRCLSNDDKYHEVSDLSLHTYHLGYWAKTDDFYVILQGMSDMELSKNIDMVPQLVLDVLREYPKLRDVIGSDDELISAEIDATQLWGNTWYCNVIVNKAIKDAKNDTFDSNLTTFDFIVDNHRVLFESDGYSFAMSGSTWVRNDEPLVDNDMIHLRVMTSSDFSAMKYGREYTFVGDTIKYD